MHELATQLLSSEQSLPVAAIFQTLALSRATQRLTTVATTDWR